jgi:hypothetical protein
MADAQRYPHLSPVVAQVADLDDQARIDYIGKDRYVSHTRAEEILDEWESLYGLDDAIRPQGRKLIGYPLMGKSTLKEEFLRRHPASDNPGGEAAIVPVVSVQFPEVAKEGIYPEILGALNAKLPKGSKTREVRQGTVDFLRRIGMRMLLIDEFHNILEGSALVQRKGLNSVKYLMNVLRRPVIVIGTGDLVNATESDPQISSRLKPMVLPRFKDDEDFQALLAGFEMVLPLRKPSNLSDPELSTLIYLQTLGIMGNVADLLNDAAKMAIKTGTEQITEVEITAIKHKASKGPRSLLDQLG